MNPDGFYQLVAVDEDSPPPSVFVGDTESNFVAGPYLPGTKVKITEARGTRPRARSGPGEIGFHLLLNGDARVGPSMTKGAVGSRLLLRAASSEVGGLPVGASAKSPLVAGSSPAPAE